MSNLTDFSSFFVMVLAVKMAIFTKLKQNKTNCRNLSNNIL